jgi:hypothetical protein
MLRNNAFTHLLVGLVVVVVMATSFLAFSYIRSVRKLNVLQLQTALISRNRTLANSLVNDVLEYSKRNPAVDPILQSIGAKPRAGAPANQVPPKSKP